MITQELLDELWDFSDPAASADRFAQAAAASAEGRTADERLELLTQQARALGLQELVVEAQALLDGIVEPGDPAVAARLALENGRLRNSSGRVDEAVPFFEEAVTVASEAGLTFLEIDALHMLAIADGAHVIDWTDEAIAIAQAAPDDRTRRWLVSLYNNLGWKLSEEDELDDALAAFRQAQRWADEVGTEQQRGWAAEAVADGEKALATRRTS